jgi:type 1 glutamine amidotransferase
MRAILLLIAAAQLTGCSGTQSAAPGGLPGANAPPLRVLMVTATAGFRHDSIPAARDTMSALAAEDGGFTITATEDVASLTAATLSTYDLLMFALTSGELQLTAEQKSALLAFVTSGRGFVGVHSAADTLHDWPEYGALLGGSFKEHPWTQQGRVLVEDRGHETTIGLGASFELVEEFYTFLEDPRPGVHVLLRLDASSVGASGDYPLAWTRSYGAGRVYYNALGHFTETWRDPRFQRQITAAIHWAAVRSVSAR